MPDDAMAMIDGAASLGHCRSIATLKAMRTCKPLKRRKMDEKTDECVAGTRAYSFISVSTDRMRTG